MVEFPKKKIGNKGFGYDPIFIPENKRLTFGQMSQKLKNFFKIIVLYFIKV